MRVFLRILVIVVGLVSVVEASDQNTTRQHIGIIDSIDHRSPTDKVVRLNGMSIEFVCKDEMCSRVRELAAGDRVLMLMYITTKIDMESRFVYDESELAVLRLCDYEDDHWCDYDERRVKKESCRRKIDSELHENKDYIPDSPSLLTNDGSERRNKLRGTYWKLLADRDFESCVENLVRINREINLRVCHEHTCYEANGGECDGGYPDFVILLEKCKKKDP